MTRRIFLASLVTALTLSLPASTADKAPVKVLIITGDHGVWHNWRQTTAFIKEFLSKTGTNVDVTESPTRDLTSVNLAKYDAFVFNYKDTDKGAPDTRWSDENKKAFAEAVRRGKGLVVFHHASSAFTSGSPFDKEFEQIIAGGWRKQGNHGKRHVFTVAIAKTDHPITRGMPAHFVHASDELYQNSLLLPGSTVLATAFSDKSLDPKNSGKHEAIVWVATYGKGRVCENVLGHDIESMNEPGFKTLMIRAVEWAATGHVSYPIPAALKEPDSGP